MEVAGPLGTPLGLAQRKRGPRHAHGDLTSLAPHERLPEILVVPRDSCLTLCDPMDSSSPGSSVHGILQVRELPFPPPGDLSDPGIIQEAWGWCTGTRTVSSTLGARLHAVSHPKRCRLYLATKAEVTKAEVGTAFDLLCLSLDAASHFPSAFCASISGLTQDVILASLNFGKH